MRRRGFIGTLVALAAAPFARWSSPVKNSPSLPPLSFGHYNPSSDFDLFPAQVYKRELENVREQIPNLFDREGPSYRTIAGSYNGTGGSQRSQA